MTNNQRIDRKTTISDRRSSSSFARLSFAFECVFMRVFMLCGRKPAKGSDLRCKNEEEKSRRERQPFFGERVVDKHSARIYTTINTSSYDGFTRRAHHLKQTEELFRLRLLLFHILRLLRGVVFPFLSRLRVSFRLFDFLPPRLLNLSNLFGFDFRSKPT